MEEDRTTSGRGPRARRALAAVAALGIAGALAGPAQADFPWAPGGNVHDPHTFAVAPPTVPGEFSGPGGVDWKFSATPEASMTSATVNNQQDELCGVRGASIADNTAVQTTPTCAPSTIHTGWEYSTGRPDVTIAVLDSGIEWNDKGAMTDLRAKVRINPGELPAPRHDMTGTSLTGGTCATGWHDATGGDYDAQGGTPQGSVIPYDVNGDGVFNVLDYACDSRVAAVVNGSALRHGPPGFLTPEDLIIAFSDGQDHDGNGFKNDIAGWNFVDDNNNPYDDVQYAHGTGEALDSNAEANNGGDVGSCPNCTVLPLRVGESFVADVNRFAQAVLYATDNRVSIVQEALGTLNNSLFSRQAIDYAYNHGVTIIASAADEAAEHHNQPGALPHTIVVNSVNQYNAGVTQAPPSYLQFNGCTNFSTKVTVAVPSSSCSSEATGKGAGVAGLIYSAALNAHELGNLPSSSDCTRADGTPCVITPNEVRQLMGSGDIGSGVPADAGNGGQADDVNFAAQPEPSCSPSPAPNCTDPNHDMVFAADQDGGVVGPVASRRYPARKGFDEFYGYGRLNAYKAVRAAHDGLIPPEADITYPDWFQQVDPAQAAQEVDGYVSARGTYTCRVDVAPGAEPNNAMTTDTPPGDFQTVSSSWCDGSTVHGTSFRGALASIDLAALKNRFPATAGAFNEREPGLSVQTNNGRPNTMPYAFTVRVVVTTGAGPNTMTGEDRRQMFLHRDQDMLAGFPKELRTDGASSPLLVDLDGDNRNELVVATSDGVIHAFRPDGSELPGWPVHTDSLPLHTAEPAYATPEVGAGHYNAVLGGLAAGDLFHDGRLEIVADDNGGKVYAWDAQGNQVFKQEANPAYSGAPLPATPLRSERLGPRDRVEHGFLASPVLAHLDGNPNGQLDIVAAGEDRHVYAWHADGTAVTGFPVLVADPDKVASVNPVTNEITFKNVAPNPGRSDTQGKIVDTPAVADITGTGKPSIIVGTNEEYPINTGDEGGMNAGNFNTASLAALGGTGLLGFGNTRLYEIKPDGTASGNPFLNPPQKLGIINAGLLPDVGEGVDGSPIVANLTCPSGGSGPKIGVIPDAGPGYIFNPDGSSCYGKDPSSGHDNALATDFTAGNAKYDTPAIPAVGYPAFGTFDGGTTTTMFAPAAGLLRALDLVINEYQGGQDFTAAWDPTTGQFSPGFPAPTNDLSFLSGEVVGDILGNPSTQEVVGGTASLDLAAFNAAGQPANTNWPKLTGDWTIATPVLGSFGTLDTAPSAHKDVVSMTRMGTLAVYGTPASACSPSSWPNFHHDIANSGDYSRDAVPPGVPMDAAVSGGNLSFLAPGNDLLCGTASAYQVATADGPITPESFAAAEQIGSLPAPQLAGTPQSIALPAGTHRYVAVRAIDGQGNVGLPATVDTGVPAPAGGTPGKGPLNSSSGPGSTAPAVPTPAQPPHAAGTTGGTAATSYLGLPASAKCLSHRQFTIRLRAPRGERLASARVYVDGRRVRVLTGRRLKAPVDLRGLPSGRFSVKIVAFTTGGRTLDSERHYRTCRPRPARRRRRSVHHRAS